MELVSIHLLAKNEGFGALVFFIIWALIAIVSQIQKWQEAKRKRQQSSPPPPPVALPRPTPPRMQRPQPRPQQIQRPSPQVTQRPIPKPLTRPPFRPVPKAPPPPPTPMPQAPPAPVAAEVQQDAYRATARSAELGERMTQSVGSEHAAAARALQDRPAITAVELSRAMRPLMLRRSFILTELLAPPLGLRDLQSAQERGSHERAPERPA